MKRRLDGIRRGEQDAQPLRQRLARQFEPVPEKGTERPPESFRIRHYGKLPRSPSRADGRPDPEKRAGQSGQVINEHGGDENRSPA